MKNTVLLIIIVASLASPETVLANLPAKASKIQFHNLHKKPPIETRIIDGEEAVPQSIPYQVLLEANSNSNEPTNWYYGGSLISSSAVLTAAQCVFEADNLTITLRAHNRTNTTEDVIQQIINKDNIVVHPLFDFNQIINDIAIIRLPTSVDLSGDKIQAVHLPKSNKPLYAGFEGTVSGWGLTNGEEDTLSDVLKYTKNTIMSNEECRKTLGNLKDTQLCLSGSGGRACNGDTGGPLTVNDDDGSPVQVGIVSYAFIFCLDGYPTVYTRTSEFLDWISKNIA